MGEIAWYANPVEIWLLPGVVWAQTFRPLWTHTLQKIRWHIRSSLGPSIVRISIQYLNPDGTPTGADLVKLERRYWQITDGGDMRMQQEPVPPIRLVFGMSYAFCIQLLWGTAPWFPSTSYTAPPGPYPRGKLIKSIDWGATWDLSDHGDLSFGEYGDPPRADIAYTPPAQHYAIGSTSQQTYNTNVCLRLSTSEPSTLRCLVTKEKPVRIDLPRITRGTAIICLDHYVFKNYKTYKQKEKDDSMYHTFFLTGLKKDEKYWLAFQAEVNFATATSQGPIFDRTHPDAPPFTTIRRPDAPGDLCQITHQIGHACPNHYKNINEASPDEDASCIWAFTAATSGWLKDLYHIPNLISNDRPIKQVHITARCRREGGMPYAAAFTIILKTHGNIYQTGIISPLGTAYVNHHWHIYDNPFTGNPWTYQEVNDLQIGVNLKWYWGVGWQTKVRCTQVYCKIYHDCSAYN